MDLRQIHAPDRHHRHYSDFQDCLSSNLLEIIKLRLDNCSGIKLEGQRTTKHRLNVTLKA